MTASEIKNILKNQYAHQWASVFVPEYTSGDLRIDALVVDTRKRWIRGFEIKTSRSDFLQDNKWILYSQFCSSISIVCPEGLIQADEINKPFGLLWVLNTDKVTYDMRTQITVWKKRPQNFQKRNSLAWFWTYTHVLETEIVRLDREMAYAKNTI